MKQLLTEYFPMELDAAQLNESAIDPSRPLKIPVTLQKADMKNRNGRIYPRAILEREAAKYMKDFVASRRGLGELDHPEERTVINLANVSHLITEMHWRGNDLIGTLEVLSTPMGNILKELLRSGVKVGISSRGVGSVNNIDESTVEVGEDFSLIGFDAVSNPSTPGAYLGESYNFKMDRDTKVNTLISKFFEELSGK